MKLIVLFVGLCVSVGVLCSVPDQVEVGSANPSYSGDVLASSDNRTSIREKRFIPLLAGLGAVILWGGVAIVIENSIVNDIDERPPQPSVNESFVKVNRLIKSFSDRFDIKKELCGPQLNRRKRQLNPNNSHCSLPVTVGENYYNDIENIAEELRNNSDLITAYLPIESGYAVDSYTTMTAPANQNHAQPIDLTVTMKATLTYAKAQHLREPIQTSITERMEEMDWYRGGNKNTNDERGHLLANSLGGPSLPWNFVPQSPSVNRGVEIRGVTTYCWFDLEADIRRILRQNPDHIIVWTIVVRYGGLPASRRPTLFLISVRHLDSDYRFIDYRQFVIPNMPSDACTNSSQFNFLTL
ncbi:uncharacterized protein LOC125778850 isoform X2 [Bactrocera dorsalis]|uniref:Uncharacterized protein LOC125778850 isoform X1 n=1 Tax=Bactrocera dorsalis TaxID=27457 RepID=A0ABM3JYI2_BACDO|nr:uncharacterized protein LOC125778850 isoform X1 [Bactrocera dorsalis]XP_049314292.1 uncharacterized protein LOC125778850 isoform X2 [Bactrocera dorsalis]